MLTLLEAGFPKRRQTEPSTWKGPREQPRGAEAGLGQCLLNSLCFELYLGTQAPASQALFLSSLQPDVSSSG